MKIQTQIQKTVELTSEEIQAIVVDHLQSTGIIEEGYDVTIENVPEVLSLKLLSKMQILESATPELETLLTSIETQELIKVAEPEDDIAATTNPSNILSKVVGAKENIGRDIVFVDPIEDLATSIETRDLFSDPSNHTTEQKVITENFWGGGEGQLIKNSITDNLFA